MKAREEASKGQINSGFCAFRRIQENERGGCKQFVFRTLTLTGNWVTGLEGSHRIEKYTSSATVRRERRDQCQMRLGL